MDDSAVTRVKPGATSFALRSGVLALSLAVSSAALFAGHAVAGAAKADFETPEYLAQKGLSLIQAASLYARGGTGKGVKVGLIDSGLNTGLVDFDGRLSGPGYDYLTNAPGVIDKLGHGTQMGGLIAANKDGAGMHGVAYDAQLIAVRFGEGEPFESDEEISKAWEFAFDGGARILSNSWANEIPITQADPAHYRAVMPYSMEVAQKLVEKGAVFVFPTGNELKRQILAEPGLPVSFPALEKGWLAVVALDNKGERINDTANYCALGARWCIAVPGGDGGAGRGLLTTDKDGGYREAAGTSAAVALVSGSLAALQSAFPQLSAQQLREVLLSTATRSGIYRNREAYGRGVMNLDAAWREAERRVASIQKS